MKKDKWFNKKYIGPLVAIIAVAMLLAPATTVVEGKRSDVSVSSWYFKNTLQPSITLTMETSSFEINEAIHVDGQLRFWRGIPGATIDLEVILPDGSVSALLQGATTETDRNGRFSIDYVATMPGDYVLTATYLGSGRYSPTSMSATFTVAEDSTTTPPQPVRWTWLKAPVENVLGQSYEYSVMFEVLFIDGEWYGARTTDITFAFIDPNGITKVLTASTPADTTGVASVTFTPDVAGDWTVKCDWDQNNNIYAWDSSPAKVISVTSPVEPPMPAKLDTAIALSGSTGGETGNAMTISGILKTSGGSAISGAVVSIQVTNPDGSRAAVETKTTGVDGTFRYSMTPSAAGEYSIMATYAGDAEYESSASSMIYTAIAPEPPPASNPDYDFMVSGNQVTTPTGEVAYTGSSYTAALQWAVKQSGKSVYMPAGTYTVTAEINPASGVTLFGDGPGPSGTVLNFEVPHLVVLPGVTDVTLKNFRTTGYGDILIAGPSSGILVQDVTAYHILGGGAAFWTWTSGNSVIDGVKFIRCIADTPDTFGFLLGGDGASDISLRTNGGWTKNIYMEDCQALNCGIYGRPNDFVCGFDLCEQTNVENVLLVRCSAINSWMNGFHLEQWPNSINVVLEDCVSSDNGVVRGNGFGYAWNSAYTTPIFKNCTGSGNKIALFMGPEPA